MIGEGGGQEGGAQAKRESREYIVCKKDINEVRRCVAVCYARCEEQWYCQELGEWEATRGKGG